MPRPGSIQEKDPFHNICDRLKRLASRVYANNLDKTNGCRALIDEREQLIRKENYVVGVYDPYQTLADDLRTRFPEVWIGDEHYCGKDALAPFLSSGR